ncbi:hypothetical protein GCM10010149_90680 [Nonomuraea roseoviolacea subsp. roseoviolacea]
MDTVSRAFSAGDDAVCAFPRTPGACNVSAPVTAMRDAAVRVPSPSPRRWDGDGRRVVTLGPGVFIPRPASTPTWP